MRLLSRLFHDKEQDASSEVAGISASRRSWSASILTNSPRSDLLLELIFSYYDTSIQEDRRGRAILHYGNSAGGSTSNDIITCLSQ